jgi:hypothetical protein
VYFSVRDDKDHGTIIDFAQHRHRLSFGELRKELRPWIGRPAEALPFHPLPTTTKDRTRVEKTYAKMQDATCHPYLEDDRAIPAALLQSERFSGRIRIDAHGNAVFPHFDRAGLLCGFELKNRRFTGFASGGTKGLWLSVERPDDSRLVFCEAAIDALSYAVLFPDERTRYASVGGQLNPTQPELMRAAAAGMPPNANVIAAMDADVEGRKLAEVVRQAVELTGRDDLSFVLQEPVGYKDWNDQLRKRPKSPLPCRAQRPSVA